MFRIDLSNTKKTTTKELNDIVHHPVVPTTLTEALDNIKLLANAMADNGMVTLNDLTTKVTTGDLKWNDDVAVYKTVNAIITINNQPDLSTDYSYLVNMLKILRDDYGRTGDTDKEGMEITLPLEKINEPNKPMVDVITTLFNVLGYEQAMVMISLFAGYDL